MKAHVLILLTLLSFASFAGEGAWSMRTTLRNTIVGHDYTLNSPTWNAQDSHVYYHREGLIHLEYTRKEQSDLDHPYQWRIWVTLDYQMNGSNSYGSPEVLEITSKEDLYKYADYIKFDIPDTTIGYGARILKIQGEYLDSSGWTSVINPQLDSHFPIDIDLRFELHEEHWYKLDVDVQTSEKSDLYFDTTNFRAHWKYVQGAEQYDLEWVWIDRYSSEFDSLNNGVVPTNTSLEEWAFLLKEPSRVRVSHTHHVLDKTYPEGRLFFRVRTVSNYTKSNNQGIYDQKKEGEWNYFDNAGNLAAYTITPANAFEPEKNWLYGVAYAEEGKSVSTVTFYDGSNRGRQSLTYNTSDDVTLIGETKFDYEGRQTVSVIPAPVQGRKLGYRTQFNMAYVDPLNPSLGTEVFDENNYDFNQNTSNSAQPLATQDASDTARVLGAAQYFSPDNAFDKDLFRAAIPDAKGYVYSQTIYRNDGSGRIEEVSGIGEEFRVGGEHSVKTYYGSTNQTELQRLFGSNASSSPQGYRKEMVRDANGQYSVTFYDKRGNVIATALAGEAPNNLLALDDQDPVTIHTPLNDNNIAVDNYTLVSEHTHLTSTENTQISLIYDMSSVVNIINTTPVNVGSQTVSLGNFCSTCEFVLSIVVLNQNGDTIQGSSSGIASNTLPFYLDSTANSSPPCYDSLGNNLTTPAFASLSTDSIVYQLPEIGEYRIIKTLSVDQQAMQDAFNAQLEASGANDPTDFINEYISNVDISGCFNTCDDYCYYFAKFQYLEENTSGVWDSLNLTSVQQAMIDSCLFGVCDINEMYENFDSETADSIPTVNPMDFACQGYRAQMIQQISPGGVYYDTPVSGFWAAVADQEFGNVATNIATIGGVDYTLNDLQNPATFPNGLPNAVIAFLLPKHKEYCHLQYCYDWAETMNYSNSIVSEITDISTPWTNAGIYNAPYANDPFIGQAWNGNSTLQDSVDAYLNNHPFTCTHSGLSYSSGNLYNYVDAVVGCLETDPNAPALPSDYYAYQRRLMFKGIYDHLKETIIKDYKLSLSPPCVYQTDQNRVFIGPMTTDEMQQEISEVLSEMLNPSDCEELAYFNAVNWIAQIPLGCLQNLSTSEHNPNFDSTILITNSNVGSGLGTLEQLFYDYTLATCPENTWGWFFNPNENGTNPNADGVAEYDAIYSILSGCGIDTLSFEVIPAPSLDTINITNQTDLECAFLYMQLINDGLIGMNAYSLNTSGIGCVGAYDYCADTTFVASTLNYPNLQDCNLLGTHALSYSFSSVDSTYSTAILSDLDNLCKYSVEFFDPSDETGLILSLSAPVKYDTLDIAGTVYTNVIVFQAALSDGNSSLVRLITEQSNLCHPYGDYSNQTLLDFDFNIPLPDYETDCIEATIGQAAIDAQNSYNGILNDLQNEFLATMENCLESVNENFRMSYQLKEYQYTLYYYDLAGNLVQTVPPQGVHPVDTTHFSGGVWDGTEPNHTMETRYKYNGLNTLVAQYTPDGGHTDFVLDKLYRVRYSQNARQANEQKASYTKYDPLGRIYEAGEMYVGQNSNIGYLQLNTEDANFPAESMRLDYTKTYYEEGYPDDSTIVPLFTDGEQKNLRNTIGAIEHFQAEYPPNGSTPLLGSEFRTILSYSYDAHKNVQEMVATNYHLKQLGEQHKTVRYDYDLISGNVNEVIYQQDRIQEENDVPQVGEHFRDEFRHRYHYDANNRLIRVFTSNDGGCRWEKQAKYFYYLHGALARMELGEDEVQGCDYAYNLQGWLKGVNASSLVASRDLGGDGNQTGDNQHFGVDAHGFMLSYYDSDYQSIEPTSAFAQIDEVAALNIHPDPVIGSDAPRNLYNGNISNMTTALRDTDQNPIDVLSNNYQYDQLQRIRSMKVYTSDNLLPNNDFAGAYLYNSGAYRTEYSFDKNGNLSRLSRYGSNGLKQMDDFTYNYYTNPYYSVSNPSASSASNVIPSETNRLANVQELAVLDSNYLADIKFGQGATNYQYDASGQLKKDLQEGIENIGWSVTGKVKTITFTEQSGKHDLKFVYDPMDVRAMKIEYLNKEKKAVKYTYYNYDAQGNVLATYTRSIEAPRSSTGQLYDDTYMLNEHMIYGASRLGIDNRNTVLTESTISQSFSSNTNIELAKNFVWSRPIPWTYDLSHRVMGNTHYKLSNHLGNVLEVISDRKVGVLDGTEYTYSADIVSYSDYYPYGMLMDGRNGGENYRHSFQGQEHDDEVKGKGNSINYKYRMHDPRIGRFFAIDPLAPKYPHNSPFAFSENNVIHAFELEGLESRTIHEPTPVVIEHNVPSSTLVIPTYQPPSSVEEVFKRVEELKKADKKALEEYTRKNTPVIRENIPESVRIARKNLDNWGQYILPGGGLLNSYIKGEKISWTDVGIEIIGIIPVGKVIGKGGKIVANASASIYKTTIKSSVKSNPKLFSLSKSTFKNNERLRSEANNLMEQLAKGNKNPGLGSKRIEGTKGIYEARSRNGARIYFKNFGNETITIVAYSNKSNQTEVIKELKKLYPSK